MSDSSLTYQDRIEGGLLGLLIGDALGVPYEFHAASQIPPRAQIDYAPPAGFHRAHNVPPGTWSDDGAMALCLLASLLDGGRLDPDDLGRRFVDWYERGYLAVDGDVFDIGIQTREALRAIKAGVPALLAGPTAENKLGNGSLMRAAPLTLWSDGDDEALVADAMTQSRLTHGHPRAQVCCALYCLWARRVAREHPQPWEDAVATLRALWPTASIERVELESGIRPDDPAPGDGGGYVVTTLRSARWAVESTSDFASAVRAAISLGNDTDTTACVTGGVAGLRYGARGIPAAWRAGLRGQDLLAPLLDRLRARVQGQGQG
ncbi:MAG TPA: ADP-ribosylglycohydrolase family protein [Ktedonobacterales bacterium]|nr:ADP-ribosylglycohydrolase family protein [Ktedonobacterales bacterium]